MSWGVDAYTILSAFTVRRVLMPLHLHALPKPLQTDPPIRIPWLRFRKPLANDRFIVTVRLGLASRALLKELAQRFTVQSAIQPKRKIAAFTSFLLLPNLPSRHEQLYVRTLSKYINAFPIPLNSFTPFRWLPGDNVGLEASQYRSS